MTSKRKWKIVSSLILASFVILLAVFVAQESVKQENTLALTEGGHPGRAPASIQKVFDYSTLQGNALESASKQRLLSSIIIAKDNQDAVIEMGNFVLSDEKSQKDFACGFYDQVVLDFDAEGVAVSGEKPHITVQSGCDVAENINSLTPIRIPVAKLKEAAPGNTEYNFYDSKHPLKVQMSNPPPQWPGQWVLTDVKLTHSQYPSRILHIQTAEIKSAVGNVKMNW